jgi:GntR family transcriptional regulator
MTGTANPHKPEGECNDAHQHGGAHPPISAALSAASLLDERLERPWRGVVRPRVVLTGRSQGHGIFRSKDGANINSIMLPVKVDPSDSTPLHEQVAGALRRAIAEGEAVPGDRLPPAKDLAAVLGVNSNTVLRALRDLRDEGILEFRRGRGVTVAGGAVAKSVVVSAVKELLRVARRNGYRADDLVALIEQLS